MKLRRLLQRAYDIIKVEHEHVYDEFREDDGSFLPGNRERALELKKTMGTWLTDAEKHLGKGINLKGKPLRRQRKSNKQHRIVVQKRSALE